MKLCSAFRDGTQIFFAVIYFYAIIISKLNSLGSDSALKKFLFVSLAVGILLVVGLITYGAYLNKAGEHQISERMSEHRIPVKGAKVERRDLSVNIQFAALKFHSNKIIDVITRASGRIDEMFVKKNDFVKEGQVVCTVVDDEMPMKVRQADISIKDAETQLKSAENNFARQQRLWDNNATSRTDLEASETNYNTAVAKLEDAKAKRDQLSVQQAYQEVVAPISGEVITNYKSLGSTVSAGTPIIMIGDFSELFCSITVPNKIAKSLSMDSSAKFVFNRQDSTKFYDESGQNLGMYIESDKFSVTATIAEITPPLSEVSENRQIVWRFDNRSKILEPSIYGEVTLTTLKPHSYLAIPTNALVSVKNPMVFVFNSEDNTINMRQISIGVTDGDYVEVVSGLTEGELVITSVTKDLKDGSKVALKEVK